MKKGLLFVLAIVMSIVFVTAASAQAPAGPPEKAAATDTKDVKATKAEMLRARGEVVSVDAAAKTMVVKGTKEVPAEMTIDIANVKSGKRHKIEDVKPGDKVMIGYTEVDGKMVAKHVGKHGYHHGKRHHKKAKTEGAEAKPAAAPAAPAK
jgi:Cu/Ag efflux protein CusF